MANALDSVVEFTAVSYYVIEKNEKETSKKLCFLSVPFQSHKAISRAKFYIPTYWTPEHAISN